VRERARESRGRDNDQERGKEIERKSSAPWLDW